MERQIDWYVSYGGGRNWADARRFNFIVAGGGRFYSPDDALATGGRARLGQRTRHRLRRCWQDAGTRTPRTEALVKVGEDWATLAEQDLFGTGRIRTSTPVDDDMAEWVVPVEWLDARPEAEAYWEKGMFASQHSACKLRQEFTLGRLADHFNIDDGE